MKAKGLTLVELLVVIGVVGILATISLTTFTGYQKKARLARAQSAAKQMKHIFLAQDTIIQNDVFSAWYKFDGENDVSQTAPFITDNSNSDNHLSPRGNVLYSSSSMTGSGVGKSLEINAPDGTLEKWVEWQPTSPKETLTIAFWVRIKDYHNRNNGVIPFYIDEIAGIRIFPSGRVRLFIDTHEGNTQPYLDTEEGVVNFDEWHYIVGTVDKNKQTMSIYVDGTKKASRDGIPTTVIQNWKPLYSIGRHLLPMTILIDEIMVFSYSYENEKFSQ